MTLQDLPVAFLNEEGDAYTTSLVIAKGTNIEHASVIKLVRTYLPDLEEFGRVRFEIRPFDTAGGTQQREVATLNEQQATLILTYMRNTAIVRGFKKKLVKAFWTLAHQRYTPITCCTYHNHHIQDQRAIQTSCPCSDKLQDIAIAIRELTNTLNNNHQQAQSAHKPIDPKTLLFLNAWWDCLGNREITANDLCRMIHAEQCKSLTQAAYHLFGKTNLTSRKLGSNLRNWSQNKLEAFHIINKGKGRNGLMWCLERHEI